MEYFTEQDKSTIARFSYKPIFLFNTEDVIPLCPSAQQMDLMPEDLGKIYRDYAERKEIDISTVLHDRKGRTLNIKITAHTVLYEGRSYFLGELLDITGDQTKLFKMQRISYIYQLMLEMTQKSAMLESLEQVYEFILEYAQRMVRNFEFCSVMEIRGDMAKVVALRGYDECYCIADIPLKDTFLYRETHGKCDRIANIADLNPFLDNYYPISVGEENKKVMLQSTISVPLRVHGKLAAVLNFDSLYKGNFNEDDIEILTLVRANIEMALVNCKLYIQLRESVSHDYLTGIHNRLYFEAYYKTADKEHMWLAVFDINDLKPVNDSFGHEWGDRVIRDFADRLSGICRENELVARTGGDEFCGVFYGNSRQEVCQRIEAIQQEITQKPPRSGDMEVRYSFSYGLEGCDECEDNSLRRMLKTTDDRMYEYKMEYKRKNCHGI